MLEFVGARHKGLLDELLDLHRQRTNKAGPGLVILRGNPGLGKTRIVQEMYRSLAADQTFWPKTLGGGRDESLASLAAERNGVFPDVSEGWGEGPPSFLWLAASCEVRQAGALFEALSDVSKQLEQLAQSVATLDSKRTNELLAAVGKTIGILGPFLPVVGTMIGIMSAAKDGQDLVRAWMEWSAKRGRGSALNEPDAHVCRTLVDQLVTISADLPVVLVLDDAHAADGPTIAVCQGVLERSSEHKLLIVATAWPHKLSVQETTDGTLGWMLSQADDDRYSQADDVRLRILDVPSLEDADISSMICRVMPRLSAKVLDPLVMRIDGNPLILESVLCCCARLART